MSDNHSLQRLTTLRMTSLHLLLEARGIEAEGFDLHAKALSLGGLGGAEDIHGASDLEEELREAVAREGLQRLGGETSSDELREVGRSTGADQAHLVHLGLRAGVVHVKVSLGALTAEQDEFAFLEIEEFELLGGNAALGLGEGVLRILGIDENEARGGSSSKLQRGSWDIGDEVTDLGDDLVSKLLGSCLDGVDVDGSHHELLSRWRGKQVGVRIKVVPMRETDWC